MIRTAKPRFIEIALGWLVIVISLALLTPWAIAHRDSIQPGLALVGIVFGTLSGAAWLVKGLVTAFAKSTGRAEAAPALALGVSLLLLAASLLPFPRSSLTPTYLVGGAALLAVISAVLQQRLRDRSEL